MGIGQHCPKTSPITAEQGKMAGESMVMSLNLSSKTWITIDGRIDHCPLYNLPIFEEIKVRGSTYDIIRRECLKRLAALTAVISSSTIQGGSRRLVYRVSQVN
jgi:hypothetical protein